MNNRISKAALFAVVSAVFLGVAPNAEAATATWQRATNANCTSPVAITEGATLTPAQAQYVCFGHSSKGVSRVDFYVDGVFVGAETSTPYYMVDGGAPWTPVAGAHQLVAQVVDRAGNHQHTLNVTVADSAPTTTTTPPTTTTTAPPPTTTPPTTTPPPTTTTPAPNALFADGFETGNFTKWRSCQWRNRNDSCQTYNGTADYSASVVAVDGRPNVARFEVRDGDIPPFGGDERAEIADPTGTTAAEGDERWIGWDMKLDPTWTTPQDWGHIVHQERGAAADGTASPGSPPVCLVVHDDGVLYVENPNPTPEFKRSAVGTPTPNQWHHYVLNVKYSPNPAVGYWQLSIDGAVAVPKTFGYTMKPGYPQNYMKFGSYRGAGNTATAVTYYDNIQISGSALA